MRAHEHTPRVVSAVEKGVFILETVRFRRRRYNLTQMIQLEAAFRWDFQVKILSPMNIKRRNSTGRQLFTKVRHLGRDLLSNLRKRSNVNVACLPKHSFLMEMLALAIGSETARNENTVFGYTYQTIP